MSRSFARLHAPLATARRWLALDMTSRGGYMSLISLGGSQDREGVFPDRPTVELLLARERAEDPAAIVDSLLGAELLVEQPDGSMELADQFVDWGPPSESREAWRIRKARSRGIPSESRDVPGRPEPEIESQENQERETRRPAALPLTADQRRYVTAWSAEHAADGDSEWLARIEADGGDVYGRAKAAHVAWARASPRQTSGRRSRLPSDQEQATDILQAVSLGSSPPAERDVPPAVWRLVEPRLPRAVARRSTGDESASEDHAGYHEPGGAGPDFRP